MEGKFLEAMIKIWHIELKADFETFLKIKLKDEYCKDTRFH